MINTLIKLKSKYSIYFTIVFVMLLITGCDKKNEPQQGQQTQEISADTTGRAAELPSTDTTSQAVKEEAFDITGKWSGTFDQRAATLTITNQTNNEFSGTLTVAYRNPLTKALSGKFDKENMGFTMSDTEHGHFKGKYTGKISDTGKMSGTFTMDVDNTNYIFSLTKK